MVRGAFLVLLLLPMLATSVQSAPARIALVIGNSEYEHTPLRNPLNDAAFMVKTLEDVGFEVMDFANLDRRELNRAFLRFGDRIKEAGSDTVSLVYYAGHGAQVNGENYLIPVKSLIEDERDVDIEGVRASSLLRILGKANAALNIVILDACRNNPFKTSSRSSQRGLARMDAPTGTLLAYSTAPGQIAEDGSGENSVYTKALSLAIRIPGAKVEEEFKRVRIEVMTRTLDEQVPWESSSLTGNFYFSGGATQVPAAAATVTQPALAIDKEAMFWQSIQGSEDADDYQAYLEQFPNGTFASLARVKVRKLQSTKSAVVAPVVEPQPAKSPTGVAASETQIAALPEPTTPDEAIEAIEAIDKTELEQVPAEQTSVTAFDGKWKGRYRNTRGSHCDAFFDVTLKIKDGNVSGFVIWESNRSNSDVKGTISYDGFLNATVLGLGSNIGGSLIGTANERRSRISGRRHLRGGPLVLSVCRAAQTVARGSSAAAEFGALSGLNGGPSGRRERHGRGQFVPPDDERNA